MISLVLADGYPSTRAGLRAILDGVLDIKIVGEAEDGFEVQRLVADLRPRILLLGLKMPGLHPAEFEKWVRENYPKTITLVLTAYGCDSYLASMMKAGVKGYLMKEEAVSHLISAIRRAAQGESIFDGEQIARARNWKETIFDKWDTLTEQERQILQLLADGLDNKAIAGKMSVVSKTVEYHVANIFRKLGASSRWEAVVWMLKYSRDRIENIGEEN
jgi:DNA-binding NarL/FixJ family response regulator